MPKFHNGSQPIGNNYPTETGRLKQIIGMPGTTPKKIALLGDSTLDNGYWVQTNVPYAQKTHTVTHQTAISLARDDNGSSYDIGNFAVDGATTADLLRYCNLDKVLPSDADHPDLAVHQLNAVSDWAPDIAVLSIGGNNYREALAKTLQEQLSKTQILLRITPEEKRAEINKEFKRVKKELVAEYKKIIDSLCRMNPKLGRIVLLSQYYPSITDFTPYHIYTGFSHVARSEGKGQNPFTAVESTMNELYRQVLQHAASKNIEIVLVDLTSSLNPLGGNHTSQIEPNEQGAKIMGRLIASAIEYNFPSSVLEDGKKTYRFAANER